MFDGLIFTIAEGRDREAAVALLADTYAREHGRVPPIEPDATFLIARDGDGGVAASFRFLGPEARPFDFEAHVHVPELTVPGRRPALLGRLCVRPERREVRAGKFVHVGLLKLALAHARKRGVTDFFMYTFDNLLAFYRTAFFRNLDRPFDFPPWGRQNLLHLDVVGLAARCAQSDGPLARLLLDPDLPGFEV